MLETFLITKPLKNLLLQFVVGLVISCPKLTGLICHQEMLTIYGHLFFLSQIMCDIWCIYRFGGLIDGYSALGVVYEVSLEVVMTMHAGRAGDAGIAIWRARLFAAHL